jgi:hypothetical protein
VLHIFDELLAAGRRLGRHVEHWAASRAHDTEVRFAPRPPRPVIWPRYSPILDQGDIGSCTGQAMAGWLGCAPHATPDSAARYDEPFALRLYEAATRLDRIPGEYPPSDTGSSGVAVAKAAQRLGLIGSYSWAFTTGGLLSALQHGPVIAGISWYEAFDQPDRHGVVAVGGQVRGGHEILIRGWQPQEGDEGLLLCDNSWGRWGRAGSFAIPLGVWARLREQHADITVPHLSQ